MPTARAFEGERVRKDDLYMEMGGGKTQCTELCKMADMNEIDDGKVEVIGPDVKDVKKGERLPLGIYVQVGRGVRCRLTLSRFWKDRSTT